MQLSPSTVDLELAECGTAVFELYQPPKVEVKAKPKPKPKPKPITAVPLPRPNPPLRAYPPPRGGRGGRGR